MNVKVYDIEDAVQNVQKYFEEEKRPKEIISSINRYIENDSKDGLRKTSYSYNDNDVKYMDVVVKELRLAGYVVEREDPQPLPHGCCSDQWDYYGYLTIGW